MNLLVDIGNTHIKWCIDKKDGIKSEQPIAYKQTDFTKEIYQQWLNLATPSELAISSVAKKQISQKMIDIAKKRWPDIKVLIARSSAHACSVTNAYQQADKLGSDRWLALIALRHFYPGNSCIADCGTAITIDCLDENGLHRGGLISPGLQLMKQSLYQGTEDLSFIKQEYSVGLSNSTEVAVYAGTLYAATGLIEKIMHHHCNSETLILTGGDAELLAKYIKMDAIIEPDFVLKGLSLYCQGEKAL